MMVPLPPQRGHGCERANRPWLWAFTPRPWHSGQTLGVVPGCAPLPWQAPHVSGLSTGTRTVTPFSASSKDSVTPTCRSEPRSAARLPRPPRRAGAAEQAGEQVAHVERLTAALLLLPLLEDARVEALAAGERTLAGPAGAGSKAPSRSSSSYWVRFFSSERVS